MNELKQMELKYLKSLANQYPNIAAASTEIINLQAILNLPKGTEHFMTDIHGECEQFNHVLKNGSGAVRRQIDEEFGNTLSSRDKKSLATLIYYPQEKLDIVAMEEDNIEDWYKITLHRLVQITKRVASKYTRSKVRKALPKDFSYIIEELITEKFDISDKEGYYNEIIHTIIRIGRAPDFIVALSNLIQRLVIDHLHIVGDIYDRGPGPHVIMDTLMNYHSVDIQWGNHDIVWMGAACGHLACIATVIRIAARYGSLDTLEDGYGINLIPLATFALDVYKDVNCDAFAIKYNTDYNTKDLSMDMKIHKAIAIMQLKLEGQVIKRHPEFEMDDRLLLDKIDYEKKTVTVCGKEYSMKDMDLPTIDPADPYGLTADEEQVMERLRQAFLKCEKLQKHVRFLFPTEDFTKYIIPIFFIMAVCRWTRREISNQWKWTAESTAVKSCTMCLTIWPEKDIMPKMSRQKCAKPRIISGISGQAPTLRYLAKTRCLLSRGILLRIKRPIRRQRTFTIPCWTMRRF